MGNIQTQPSPNQIWYTSTDGAVIKPAARYFSAIIVSNSYDSGWGIITFNRPLTDIGWNAFLDCPTLASIIFPMGVTEIAEGVCQNCTALEKAIMPDSVTKIGAHAFAGCSSLKRIVIPESCTNIGENAFDNHTEVVRCAKALPADDEIWYTANQEQAIEFREILADADVLSNDIKNGRGVIKFSKAITAISKSAFYDCTTLTSITLPQSVVTIGDYAFSGCANLNNLILSDSVLQIGTCSFEGCLSLKTLQLGNKIEHMGEYAFARCTSLKSFTVPDGVTTVSEGLLSGCMGITKIYLGSSVSNIEPYAFEHCNIVNVYLTSPTPKFGSETLHITMGMKLYVPEQALDTYKSYEGWQQHSDRICGYTPEQ